ncbi:MAG: polyribonucleotide nucleotidyltransferase [Firmicutes bacterium]|nr:polyribonucleotide nucleotidyltransferase [Bacillota bacterium]
MESKIKVEREWAGKKLILETGELAKQAGGAVLVTYADTVILATATCSEKPREGIDFFPMTVDFEEKLYAAGKIPGGFLKREGRPTEKATLTSRLIDRPLRPLFPEGFRNDVQIVAMTLSADQENDPDIPAIIGASAALTISNIPFNGPVAAVRIGLIDGNFAVNPTFKELEGSRLNLIVAGTRDAIMMVEAGANEVSEDEMLKAFQIAHENIKEIISMIDELAAKAGKKKLDLPVYKPDKDLEILIRKNYTGEIKKAMRITDKQEREQAFSAISREAAVEVITREAGDARDRLLSILLDAKSYDFETIIKKIQEEELRNMVVDDRFRPDGRRLDEIRPLDCKVGVLPRTHGSAVFTRGQTQVLTTVTLGAPSEKQNLDSLAPEESKRYIHHYNFPSFSVGETRPMRGPGRREIGHGALAERALLPMIPSLDEFPYTLRLVSDVLESNGSTSMASTCASSLSLFDAGVPVKKAVAGIAMGLIMKGDKFAVLTDIQGMEDALGEMDFKVAGTRDGITAMQMDIKVSGISHAVMEQALSQAKAARLKILDVMETSLPAPRTDLSKYAPRMIIIVISTDKIKDVIGPGGKIINKIISETGVKIDIEQDGRIFIASVDMEAGQKAQKMIEKLTQDVEVGEVYIGKVSRIMNFGAFVEILPGKEGLVHISQFGGDRVERVEDVANVGDELTVKVSEIDSQGRINLTRRGLVPGFEGEPAETGAGSAGRPPHRGGSRDRDDRPRKPYRR